MRKWIALFEAVDWMNSGSLQEMINAKDDFLQNPGVDVDHDGIYDEVADFDEDNAEEAYFDFCVSRFTSIIRDGTITLFREISVADVHDWLGVLDHRPLGVHWSYDRSSASCEYHSEAALETRLLLTAQVRPTVIHWPTTFQQHFSHPHEHEITVMGDVFLTSVADGNGNIVARPNKMLKA
jgi:hypothetical protein